MSTTSSTCRGFHNNQKISNFGVTLWSNNWKSSRWSIKIRKVFQKWLIWQSRESNASLKKCYGKIAHADRQLSRGFSSENHVFRVFFFCFDKNQKLTLLQLFFHQLIARNWAFLPQSISINILKAQTSKADVSNDIQKYLIIPDFVCVEARKLLNVV